MKPELIVMLTHNDMTVPNAIEMFEECRGCQVQHWGFKDVGLPVDQMKELVERIKMAGKTACLEVVRYTEEECLESARLALDCGFDYLMGTLHYDSVDELLRGRPIKYMPFCGRVSGSPSVLEGAIQDIIAEAKRIAKRGVHGFDLLAYRYVGDAEDLARRFIREVDLPVVIAGSIGSFERLKRVKEMGPWGLTIGGAFFEQKFGEGLSFREQVDRVAACLS